MTGNDVQSIAQNLIDMGFDPARVQTCLSASEDNKQSIDVAMDWLLSHSQPVEDADESTADTPDESPSHALSEEEKAAKLDDLEKLRIARRREREEKEKQEQMDREKKRVVEGKQMQELRSQLQDKELIKAAEERRREKLETERARERVRAQIEEDKRLRRERASGATACAPPKQSATPVPAAPKPKESYDATRIQIRLPNGSSMVSKFNATETLASVRVYVQMNRQDGVPSDIPVKLMTTFPRRVFTDEDYTATLASLDLTPSAVLIVTK